MAAMSRARRRIIVMHLMRLGMGPADIAAELSVSADTVRRDAAAGAQDARQDAGDAQQVMRPVAAPVAAQVARYERQTDSIRTLLAEELSVEQMDALEASDEDAPSDAVAERLAALADWQEALSQLVDVLDDEGDLRPYLEAQQTAYDDARARTNAVFVGWKFGGWARTPQDAEDARPVTRPGASGLLLPETPQVRQELAVLCAAYSARPEDVARFAIHQAAQHVQRWQAARRHNEGRRTA